MFAGAVDSVRTRNASKPWMRAGGASAGGNGDLAEWGIDYLMRRAICIGGGTT